MNLNRRVRHAAGPFLAGAFVAAIALVVVRPIDAAIVVDPLSTGATDVSFGSSIFTPYIPVTNPVADPLNSPASDGLLVVGRAIPGSLRIDGGSQANIRQIWIGLEGTSTGLLHIDGVGSKLTTFYGISIGQSGAGELRIFNGAVVETEDVGVQANIYGVPSQLVMSGNGTKLKIVGGLSAGAAANATVITTDGALLEATSAYIGSTYVPSGTATATVSNSAKWELSDDLVVGFSANGELAIASGGEVNAKRVFLGNHDVHDPAAVALAGGTLRAKELYVGAHSFAGTGTVLANGLVADMPLVFDAAHGLVQAVPIAGQPGVSLQLDQHASSSLGAGYAGTGTLTIADGRQVACLEGYLGYRTGSVGHATVTGAGSKWVVNGDLRVGYEGRGSLSIGTGGTVEVHGQLQFGPAINGQNSFLMLNGGQLNVEGLSAAPSQLLGQGTIQTNGVHLDAELVFEQPGVGGGSLLLDDLPNQQITIAFEQPSLSLLGVGYQASGDLKIRNGAKVSSHSGRLGHKLGSHGTAVVSGAGSEWKVVDDELLIGSDDGATGTLRVLEGGLVESDSIDVSMGSTLEVAGSDSRVMSNTLSVGGYQFAPLPFLHIHAGGKATFDDIFTDNSQPVRVLIEGVGSQLTATDIADFQQGRIDVRDGGELTLGSNVNLNIEHGLLRVDGGTVNMGDGDIFIANGHLLLEDGTLRGFAGVVGDLLQSGGNVEVSVDQSRVLGDYVQDKNATLSIDLAENHSPMLVVDGIALMEGTLDVELLSDISQYDLGHVARLLYATSGILDEFEDILLPQLPIGMAWSLERTFHELNLELIAGDFNSDGRVDAADYTVWRDSLGENVAEGTGADGDRNGQVDEHDYWVWNQFYGRTVFPTDSNVGGRAANSIPAPEPSSALVWVTAFMSALACRRR